MSEEPEKRLTQDLVLQYAEQMRVGPDDYMRLLRTFLSRNAERLEQLRSALSSGDRETAERVAHSMKGTALTLRLSKMAEIATGLEDSLRQGMPSGMDATIAALEEELALIAANAEDCWP
jgi:two-component system sensor histidine kinase/response regulator